MIARERWSSDLTNLLANRNLLALNKRLERSTQDGAETGPMSDDQPAFIVEPDPPKVEFCAISYGTLGSIKVA
jgi:hypothetical protein